MTWLLIVLALFIQEPASTDAAIFQARHLGLNLWLFNSIWAAATVADIWVGYFLGKWIQKRFADGKFEKFSHTWAERVENFIGERGEKFALVLLGIINFPYLNSFLASWLKFPFKKVCILIFIGDAVYWVIAWGINLGVRSLITDSRLALYVVVGIGLIFAIVSKAILDRVLKLNLKNKGKETT
ncbi:MAG: hypothetical protein HYW65_04620 [Candidatus Liptonbacteria bacterium]|nr:hypothetical protein [Candidatus Liptonbacteria bacterium]